MKNLFIFNMIFLQYFRILNVFEVYFKVNEKIGFWSIYEDEYESGEEGVMLCGLLNKIYIKKIIIIKYDNE